MRLTSATVRNFRLLKDVTVAIDPSTTLVVGRNNSGKTSLADVFYKFFGSEGFPFEFTDLSSTSVPDIERAAALYEQSEAASEERDLPQAEELLSQACDRLPSIELEITIEYEENDDLALLSDVILDLDPTCHDATVVASVEVSSPLEFLKKCAEWRRAGGKPFVEHLNREYGRLFRIRYRAVDRFNPSVAFDTSRAAICNIFPSKFIYAQNKLDDNATDSTSNLSRTFENYYNANGDDQNPSVEDVERTLEGISETLDQHYEDLFKPIFEDLKTFGMGTIPSVQQLKVVSLLEARKILHGNTRLCYQTQDSHPLLPEGSNGLGYTKLIFTILEFVGFYENFIRGRPTPGFQLVFIEEPEAHLHPQMQDVFIKNIRGFIERKTGWNVQVIITTHSSHIVSGSNFHGIRYFDNSVTPLAVRDLALFKTQMEKDGRDALRFLKQYMDQHKCDMFFADQVILIEGAVEQLLLPEMIARCAPGLNSKYVSTILVGGAYARNFKRLLQFLNVQTLIITDLDAVDPAAKRAACPPATPGAVTCNQTLKSWLPKLESVHDLLACGDDKKIEGRVRVAFQVPEAADSSEATLTGRSFEQAFMLANAERLIESANDLACGTLFGDDEGNLLSAEAVRARSYDIAKEIDKKTDFAFDLMTMEKWETPRYIKEGLEWLLTTPPMSSS